MSARKQGEIGPELPKPQPPEEDVTALRWASLGDSWSEILGFVMELNADWRLRTTFGWHRRKREKARPRRRRRRSSGS